MAERLATLYKTLLLILFYMLFNPEYSSVNPYKKNNHRSEYNN